MDTRDVELARKVRDIIAVVAEDLDAVTWDVEDGVAYIEGVVPTREARQAITSAVQHVEGINHVVTSLATEHIMPPVAEREPQYNWPYSAPVTMHYHSLS